MAYKVIILYQLYMPSYFLGTFTEYPYLPVQDFVRVHRSYIVNINSVDSFIGNMLFIGNCRIPISKSHKNEVLERLNLIGEV